MSLTALKASIAKWEEIVAGTERSAGPHNCALCQLYFWQECEGCPVFQHTRQTVCRGTPYDEFCDHDDDGYAVTRKAQQLAQAEVDFLKELLP